MKNFLIWVAVFAVGIVMILVGFWVVTYTAPVINTAGEENCPYSTWQIIGANLLEIVGDFIWVFGIGVSILGAFCSWLIVHDWWHNLRRQATQP